MSSPTPEQLRTARGNLSNLRELNVEVYPHVLEKIQNAYLLFTIPDNDDPGMTVILKIIDGVFGAIGSEGGAAGEAAAAFLSGMIARWVSDPPSTLNTQFASYYERYDKTSLELNKQLDTLSERLGSSDTATVLAAWNTSFTYNGKTAALSDLASVEVPKPETPEFDDMVEMAELAQNQAIWRQLLQANYYVPYYTWYHRGQAPEGPPLAWARYRLESYKYCYYVYYQYNGGAWYLDDPTWYVWIVNEYVICKKNTVQYRYLNDAACDYLFKDSTPGTIINPNGLFTRQEVVDFLGIKHVETGPYVTQSHLQTQMEPQGREALEMRIIEKAQDDAVFADALARNPKVALEDYLDIEVPEDVNLTVVLEDPQNLGLVIRGAKRMGR